MLRLVTQLNTLGLRPESVERRLKERLTGAAVLILLAVIFIPMLLDNSVQDEISIKESNIPPRPAPLDITEVRRTEVQTPFESTPAPSIEQVNSKLTETNEDSVSGDNLPVDIMGIPESEFIAESPPVQSVTVPETIQPAESVSQTEEQSGQESSNNGLNAWVIQLGSFSSQENATGLVQQLQMEGYPAFVEQLTSGGSVVYRVRVGPEVLRADAEKTLDNLRTKLNLDGIVLRYP